MKVFIAIKFLELQIFCGKLLLQPIATRFIFMIKSKISILGKVLVSLIKILACLEI